MQQLNDVQSCKTLERVLNFSTEKQIRTLFSKMNKYLFQIVTGKYSSFLFQKILQMAAVIIKEENENIGKTTQDEDEEDDIPLMKNLMRDSLELLSNSWVELLFHKNASFVLRTYIEFLSSQELFKSYLEMMLRQIYENVKPTQWMYDPVACPVLIYFLENMDHKTLPYQELVNFLFEKMKPSLITNALDHTIASRVVDALISVFFFLIKRLEMFR
jgi:Fe-S cluster biosynthesis and repair protein YggX